MTTANNVTALKINPESVLEQALKTPCPLCKSTDLSKSLWSLDDGEVDAVECNNCHAGAPAESWIKRSQLTGNSKVKTMGIIILYGLQGSGKSRRAEEYRAMYGCSRVVDDWDGISPLNDGDLVITNIPPPHNVPNARAIDVVKAKANLLMQIHYGLDLKW